MDVAVGHAVDVEDVAVWGGRLNQQTLPAHVVVDACSNLEGNVEQEIVAWGLGEDITIRWGEKEYSRLTEETWMVTPGATSGFSSGIDDVTVIFILKDITPNPTLLVGRASGNLQLLSTSRSDFGGVLASYQPLSSGDVASWMRQDQVQHFDIDISSKSAAVITKDQMFIYPLIDRPLNLDQESSAAGLVIHPREPLDLNAMEGALPFGSLHAVKYMANGSMVLTNPIKRYPSPRYPESLIQPGSLQSTRDLLPVNTGSIAGGSGTTILSSHDDGTIRLQDLRTPAAFDTIYQDHFEPVTPLGPLISHGIERFIAGSARASILKIFDFRWSRSYSWVDAQACSERPMIPTPKSVTLAPFPAVAKRKRCCHVSEVPCYLHALARTDFYKPNCNIYLTSIDNAASPVYSLAKPSDLSPSVYASFPRCESFFPLITLDSPLSRERALFVGLPPSFRGDKSLLLVWRLGCSALFLICVVSFFLGRPS